MQFFSKQQLEESKIFYDENGFALFDHVFEPHEIVELQDAYDQIMKDFNPDKIDPKKMNDAIYQHPTFEKAANDPRVWGIAHQMIERPIELQHSKFVYKPKGEPTEKRGYWHQDIPFFPHTNTDLVAVLLHLDDETEDSGSLQVVPGSHKRGELAHANNGEFAYRCIENINFEKYPPQFLTGSAGFVSCHHGLTIHGTEPKQDRTRARRLLVLQFRAQDAIQLAGAVWKCSGDLAYPRRENRVARFPDGTTIPLRDKMGRLIDMSGKFKPDF